MEKITIHDKIFMKIITSDISTLIKSEYAICKANPEIHLQECANCLRYDNLFFEIKTHYPSKEDHLNYVANYGRLSNFYSEEYSSLGYDKEVIYLVWKKPRLFNYNLNNL